MKKLAIEVLNERIGELKEDLKSYAVKDVEAENNKDRFKYGLLKTETQVSLKNAKRTLEMAHILAMVF